MACFVESHQYVGQLILLTNHRCVCILSFPKCTDICLYTENNVELYIQAANASDFRSLEGVLVSDMHYFHLILSKVMKVYMHA